MIWGDQLIVAFLSFHRLYDTSSGSSGSNGWECFFKGEGIALTSKPVPETLSVIVLEVEEQD